MSTIQQFMVGMADIHVAKGPAKFTCLGLGSCIGLALYDPRVNVSGMIHIMLPAAFEDRPVDKIGKFADTGIPALIAELGKLGAETRRFRAAYSGGAAVFASSGQLDVGKRNYEAVAQILKQLRIPVMATDIGGTSGRTMVYTTDSGLITVRTVLTGERTLCDLSAA